MEAKYKEFFDGAVEEDAFYCELIRRMDYKILSKVVEEDLDIINNSELSVEEWERFKSELLEIEEDWGLRIFQCDHNGIGVNWDSLHKMSTRYFQVHMALEMSWPGKTPLAPVWWEIDSFLNKK